MQNYEKYMLAALKEAEKADAVEETPVGVVIIKDNKIIAKAHNSKKQKKDPTRHAEIIAIQKASKKIGDWRLNGCLLFATVEPCIMCIGAIIESRITNVFCGTKNNKYHSFIETVSIENKVNIEYGLLEEKCKKIIKDFFIEKRKK